MAEEKDKIENEEVKFDNNYVSESYARKFIKTGLLAIGASILFKGKNNELLKTGVTAATALALSDDKDYSKDAIVIASLFGVKNAAALSKAIIRSDFKNFEKVYKYAEKSDEIINKFNLASINLFTKATETYSKNLAKASINNQINNSSVLSQVVNTIKIQGSSIFNTAKDSISYLYKNGISASLDNINNNKLYNDYKATVKDIDLKELEIISNDIKNSFNLNINDMEVGTVSAMVDRFINTLTPDRVFVSKQEQLRKSMDIMKKYKKFQKIENNTFFTDMLGMYTKLEDGKINLRLDKILDDKMHFADGLQKLASNFKAQYSDNMNCFNNLSNDKKEEMFVEYLRQNGFEELVEKAYKNQDELNFGDVQELIYEKSDEFLDYLKSSRESKTSFLANDDVLDINHIDVLKNFSFTNVVKKGANGFIDETSLNGHINMLQMLGAIEKNAVASFKIPILDRVWNTWNPFKLIESKSRIKNELVNNVMGFYYNQQGYLLNGARITQEAIETYKNAKPQYFFQYATDNRRDVKVVFNKQFTEIINESFKVSRETEKQHKSYTELFKIYKEKGFKEGFQETTNSFINPFSFRYNKDSNKFSTVKETEGYFKEGSIVSKFFNKSDINVSAIRAENDLIETYANELKYSLSNALIEGINNNPEYKKEIAEQLDVYLKNKINELELPTENNSFNSLRNAIFDKLFSKSDLDSKSKMVKVDEAIKEFIRRGYLEEKDYENVYNYFNIANALNDIQSGDLKNPYIRLPEVQTFFMHEISDESSTISNYFKKEFLPLLSQHGYDEQSKIFSRIHNFITSYEDSMYKSKKEFNNLIHSKSSLYYNFIDEYNKINSYENNDNIFNPLYEILKGHATNKVVKEYLDEDFLQMLKESKYIGRNGTSPNYANTTLETISQITKDFIKNDSKVLHTDSYKIFDKIEDTVINSNLEKDLKRHDFDSMINSKRTTQEQEEMKNRVDDLKNYYKERNIQKVHKYSFKDLIDEYNKIKFIKTEAVSSSVMIRSTELSHRNMKNILNNVRETIYNLLDDTSREKDELEGKMNLLSKIAISNLQDTLEYIGIERLTQNELGNNGLKQIYNFMKYRYLPLAAILGGAIAVDTFSDAVVPDDVPIIGNGISGAAIKGVAASRIGLQYALQGTGMLSVMRGIENAVPGIFNNAIGDSFDILMSPSEMIDVYFRGKPIEVKDNRWWFTAGRQSAQGEEFRQYRPHLWYIWQNKDSGIYSNKFEKLFRRDFALTKYPWYLLDPYKEEREAYKKYGAVYPMTEQLFLEVPVIGQFLNATLGEVIKPTQFIGEERWRVGDDMMINPDYDPNDPSSPKYIKFSVPNKIVKSAFEAIEDLKTFSGLPGYGITKISELFFGASNPYQNEVSLASIDEDTGIYSRYEELQLGDLFGTTEPIRRLIDDSNSLGMIKMNPLEQNLPEWLPEYFRHGNNPYMTWDFGNYILPGREFDRSENNSENEELNQFRVLSLTAPSSDAYEQLQTTINNKIDELSNEEKKHYYESLAFAEHYGEREYLNKYNGRATDIKEINLTIDKKISPYEFISDGKRYKLDTVTDNFNLLSERYGSNKATNMIDALNNMFQEGKEYSFKISNDATYSVGIDKDGDYFKIDSSLISDKYNLEKSSYRSSGTVGSALRRTIFSPLSFGQEAPMNIAFEKLFGIKSVYQEWSSETVQAPFFRDWDTPVSSFLMPFYTYSSNQIASAYDFSKFSNSIYMNSEATFNLFGTLNKLGMLKLPYNKLTGNITTSQDYENETKVHDELEKIKLIAGDKSYLNLTGKEKIKQFSDMVNEQDAEFLEDLANVSNPKEREKILNSANERLSNVLKTIWNRHQMAINNTLKYEDIVIPEINNVVDIGAYYGNDEEARNRIKTTFGISLSKLDIKRQGVFNAYRGIESEREAQFIYNRMYRQYNSKPYISSTIYGQGVININKKRGEEY